jgi:hypothetical protein
MSAEIKRLFPEGLRNNEAERSKPRHDPPLRFVPVKSLAKEDGVDEDDKSITVELCDKTTLKVVPYSFVDVESFLNYQKKHAYILDQQELKTKWRKQAALIETAEVKIDAISPETADSKEKSSRKKQIELRDVHTRKRDGIIAKAFNLYQQMSAPALRAEWDDIVNEHCFSTGWLDVENELSELQRGQNWETLADCKRLHLLTVCDQDAAERHDQYMNVTIKKPQRLPVKPFYKRLKELDELAPSLPCLKDQPDCPSEVDRRNISMSPFAMCGLLMRNVTVQIEDEYNCLHNVVPTNPKKLVEQLTKIETKLNSNVTSNKTSNDRRKSSEGQPENSEESRRSKKRAAKTDGRAKTDKIPRKVKIPTHVEQGCKLCREYGGSAKSHSTLNCKKWLPGGKSHPEWRGGKTPANINVHQNQGVNQLMAQQAEFQKSILKQISKMSGKKKKKRRKRSYSDSESSDSD